MLQQQRAEQPGLLGKLHPGDKKLKGKTFYLDNVKKRPAALLLEAISLLGGGVESFLHRDVSFVVTGSQEGLEEKRLAGRKTGDEPQRPLKHQESVLDSSKRRPVTPRPVACGSRGKALLEKAIRNNERLQASNVLANARSWGVNIVHVDDVLIYLKKLNSERVVKSNRAETSTKQPSCHVVKAAPLRSPFLKIEDVSRKYKPLHMQSMSFPSLCYLGRFSPFETPPPPRFEDTAQGEDKSRPKSKAESRGKDQSQTVSPWPPRKKNISYCECCLQSFANLDEHLQSDQHRAFATEISNYSVLERLVVKMVPAFELNPSEQAEEALNRAPTAPPIPANCELEPLTDAEMENEVQAMKGQSSFPIPAPDPPLQSGKSPEEPHPVPNPTSTPSAIQCPKSDDLIHTATTPLPVLDTAPPVHFPPALSPCPTTQDVSFDPYAMPPTLSPQVFTHNDTEPRSLYSEPPVLSPQNFNPYDYECEMETTISMSESLPISFLTLPSVAKPNMDEMKGPHPELVSKEAPCPATPNLKKRRRYSSCDHNRRKRKRTGDEERAGSESHIISERTSVQVVQPIGNASLVDRMCPPVGDRLPSSSFNMSGHTVETRWSPAAKMPARLCSQDWQQSTSVCIDPALIPDVAQLSPSSSDSDWDCQLLSGMGSARSGSPPGDAAAAGEPDTDFIHRPCAWMSDTSYESRLHTALQPATPAGESSAFSRTVVPVVEKVFTATHRSSVNKLGRLQSRQVNKY
ncbi:uncharacterized protein dbf4b isoform X2 [Vanacampus margaritifer]